MSRNSLAILFAILVGIVLTPVVAKVWRRIAPSTHEPSERLTDEAWHRSDAVAKEAMVATVIATASFAYLVGFGTRLDAAVGGMLISGFVVIPTAWVLLRTGIIGKDAVGKFVVYFEQKHRISFRSWLFVSGIGLAVYIASLIRLVTRSA